MQFNLVNNKERQCSSESVAFPTWACAKIPCALRLNHVLAFVGIVSILLLWQFNGARLEGSPPPPPHFFPLFHCSRSVTGACPHFCMGAHGWSARICQPWEQSPSRSWLPIVEAPGYRRHRTSILRCSC